MADGIYQHVDVREEGKENAFSLGHTLWINNEVSWFCCGGGGCWSVAYRVFLIHCRSLKIWMKLLLGTFSQWRHLPGICWGISTSRSATGEAGRYVYWVVFFFCDIVLIIELWAVCLFCLGLHILSCSSCSLSVRKWKSCWCGQRGRSPPSSLTLFQHAKIYQENSS